MIWNSTHIIGQKPTANQEHGVGAGSAGGSGGCVQGEQQDVTRVRICCSIVFYFIISIQSHLPDFNHHDWNREIKTIRKIVLVQRGKMNSNI